MNSYANATGNHLLKRASNAYALMTASFTSSNHGIMLFPSQYKSRALVLCLVVALFYFLVSSYSDRENLLQCSDVIHKSNQQSLLQFCCSSWWWMNQSCASFDAIRKAIMSHYNPSPWYVSSLLPFKDRVPLDAVTLGPLLTDADSLQWRHNGRDSVSNHQHHYCLLNRLFRRI